MLAVGSLLLKWRAHEWEASPIDKALAPETPFLCTPCTARRHDGLAHALAHGFKVALISTEMSTKTFLNSITSSTI